ncbi:MAG: GGDEF domain-containing protein [Pseudomonadota bacterium]
MKFLSIFSNTSGAGASADEAEAARRANAAATLFGIPKSERTPAVNAALSSMAGEIDSLRSEVSGLAEALRDAETMADHDPLLPVFNRRAFVRELSRLLSFARRYDMDASVVYFDLDGFKTVNDRYGHAAGDAVLQAVCDVLVRQTRESDLIGRLGGDEFAVVLAQLGAEAAAVKAASLQHAIEAEHIEFEGETLSVGASYGLCPLVLDEGVEIQLARADEAMYAAKAARKGLRRTA